MELHLSGDFQWVNVLITTEMTGDFDHLILISIRPASYIQTTSHVTQSSYTVPHDHSGRHTNLLPIHLVPVNCPGDIRGAICDVVHSAVEEEVAIYALLLNLFMYIICKLLSKAELFL